MKVGLEMAMERVFFSQLLPQHPFHILRAKATSSEAGSSQ